MLHETASSLSEIHRHNRETLLVRFYLYYGLAEGQIWFVYYQSTESQQCPGKDSIPAHTLIPGVAQILQVQISVLRVDTLETQFPVVGNTFIYILKVFARAVSKATSKNWSGKSAHERENGPQLVKWINSGEAEGR